jgi:pimeloyl-ACP methyl ester carboxylesterase
LTLKHPTLSRRTVLLSFLGLGAGGGTLYLFNANRALPAADPVAEKRFRDLQNKVLARYGVPASSQFYEISTPRLRLHVIESGHGEPVVFIHGGNSVAAGWIPLLARLHERFHLLAPDRPGCGLTTKFNYVHVSLRPHAVAFVGAVMDVLQLPRAAIVGNSMGGYFALAFALAHPERVSKLVLVGEPAGSAPQIRPLNRLIGTRIINSALFASVLKPGPRAMRNGFENLLVADVSRVPDDLLDCLTAGSLIPGAKESWITMNESVYTPEGAGLFAPRSSLSYALRPELGGLKPPTLLLWGDRDTFGAPALGQEMARLMPNGRCDVIRDAGHLAWVDQPDICAERIGSFLTS